ncbi:MAG: S-adenosylmethionine:tRNA ribosyltransferase-isomerase, partial [Acidimicrobiales bacterium]|nr:S-adenosylmethionine:tRNA ribosyltransferase-isomerase [Acidimicrobiales bacterium]
DGPLLDGLDRVGQMPLPPYIGQAIADAERYQTVFSDRPASAAAPTAGLHLTEQVLERCRAAGADVVEVELVVGLDTFRPVMVDDLSEHAMHTEFYAVPPATWRAVHDAERVIAIGTTVVRALESAAARDELSGRTDLFIRAPYEFALVDVLLTNFHLPQSTLLVMIDAFVGPAWKRWYAIALDARYRFLSFGDAMLLRRNDGEHEKPS